MTNQIKGTKKHKKSPLMWVGFIILLVIEAVLVDKLLISKSVSVVLTISVVTIAGLLVFVLRNQDFGSLSIRKGELKAELNDVKKRVDNVDDQVGLLFLATMSPQMYMNLKKLANPPFGNYEKREGSPFDCELYHLRDFGYVEVFNPKNSMRDIPESGANLSDYVRATPQGKLYVQLREKRKLTIG